MFKALLLISSAIISVAAQEESAVDGCLGRAPFQKTAGNTNVDEEDRNVQLLKAKMTPQYRVKKIKGCISTGVLRKIEVTLGNPETGETLKLDHIGRNSGIDKCTVLNLEDEEFVKTIEVNYVRNYVRSVGMITTEGNTIVWGTPQSVNSKETWNYLGETDDDKYEFIGFIGAGSSTNVRNLSPVAFKVDQCRNGEVEEEIEEEIEEVVEEIVDELEDGEQGENSTTVSEDNEEQAENPDNTAEPAEGDEAQTGDNQEGESTDPNATEGATQLELQSGEGVEAEDGGLPVVYYIIGAVVVFAIIAIVVIGVKKGFSGKGQPAEQKKSEPVATQDGPSVINDGEKETKPQSAAQVGDNDNTNNLDEETPANQA